jgi:hypothetical protein
MPGVGHQNGKFRMESSRFSDRIGVTQVRTILQIEGMSQPLRNSLWNCILNTFFEGDSDKWYSVTRVVCEGFFKIPVDSLPFRSQGYEQRKWLRTIFFNEAFEWYHVYNLIEFLAEHFMKMHSFVGIETFKSRVNKILEEEMSGYRFLAGVLSPISNAQELQSVSSALDGAQIKDLFGTKNI